MPTKLFPAHPAGQRPEGSTTARRPLRALVLTGLALGLVLPASAAHADPTSAQIQQQINKKGAALEKIVEEYNKVNEDLKKTTEAATKHAATLPALQSRYAAAEAEVSAIATTAYKSGQLREMNAMLDGATSNAMLDRIGTLDHLARGRRVQIAEYTAAKSGYDAEKQRLDTALAKQRIQIRDLNARKKKIDIELKKLYQMRREAYGQEQESGGGYTGTIPAVSGSAGTAVSYAYNAIGKPYSWGADGPNGYDCSGLTMAAWRAAGASLPHNAADQWGAVAHISRSQLKAGDLVFYSGLGHVAIYVGSSKIIHAPQAGENVKLASVNSMSVYGYGRVR